jgi:hypothetical protein
MVQKGINMLYADKYSKIPINRLLTWLIWGMAITSE